MLNYSNNNNIFEKLETRVLRFTKRKFFQFIFSLDSIMHQVKTRHSQVINSNLRKERILGLSILKIK